MKGLISSLLFLLISLAPAASLKNFLPIKKGDYATLDLDRPSLAWARRFSMVEAGGPGELSEDLIIQLRSSGTRVIFYRWFPADYHYMDGEDDPLMQWAYTNRNFATLNPDGPFPHCEESGYDWCQDYYFDFGNDRVRRRFVNYLMEILAKGLYDGIFFDWASGVFINEEIYSPMRVTFRLRHPETSYLRAVAETYRLLRHRVNDGLIVTNQGFRNPAVLTFVDYDMTESYGTGSEYFGKVLRVEGRGVVSIPQTVYYPVSPDPLKGSLKDTLFYLDYLWNLKLKAGGRFKNFIYMNYAAPEFREVSPGLYRATFPKGAIFFGYSVAKLRGFISYTEIPFDRSLEKTDLYFYDLGKPRGDSYEKVKGGFVRYYTGGLVVVGEWERPVNLCLNSPFLREKALVYDLYRKTWAGRVKNHSICVRIEPEPDNLRGKSAPSGRVFLYPSGSLEKIR